MRVRGDELAAGCEHHSTSGVIRPGVGTGNRSGPEGPRPRRTTSGRRSASGSDLIWRLSARANRSASGFRPTSPLGALLVIASSATYSRGKGRTKVSTSDCAIVEDLDRRPAQDLGAVHRRSCSCCTRTGISSASQQGRSRKSSQARCRIEITESFLAVSVYIATRVMVFLSLVLRSRVNRWTNIVLPIPHRLYRGFGYR